MFIGERVNPLVSLASALLTVLLLGAAGPEKETAAGHFQHGRDLIDANSGDSALATREGLVRGAEEIEKAIALGYSDRVGALKLLGLAWYRVAAWGGGGDTVALEARSKAKEAYGAAAVRAPKDVEALSGYASLIEDKKERLKAFQRILGIAPNDAGTLFTVGLLLTEEVPDLPGKKADSPGRISKRQFDEGVQYLKRAARAMDAEAAEEHGQGKRIVGILESHGRKKEAEEVSTVLEEKVRAAKKKKRRAVP